MTAFHFQGAWDFDGLERFVGGDAEFRGGRIVVAGPDGPIRLPSDGGWIVHDEEGYTPWTNEMLPDHFEVIE